MKFAGSLMGITLIALFCGLSQAQQPSATAPFIVPQLVNYSGTALDGQSKPMEGIAGVTFSIYSEQYNGAALWMETQNVIADSKGNYSVQLGAATSQGLPLDVFTTGEARWLGVRINGGEEQPRVLLLSVPYALKAADAQTLGGLPASAFVLAAPSTTAAGNSSAADASVPSTQSTAAPNTAITGSGTLNFLPLWDSTSDILSSALFQSGSGAAAKIGINTTTPASTLDIKGGATVRGFLSLPATALATSTAGKTSQPEKLTASAYSSSTQAAVNENFQWQAEPIGNDTASPSGTLNLLFGSGTANPTETGLNIASDGQITFAKGQLFPGTGTITGITTNSSSGLMGGVTSGTATLTLLTNCTTNQVLEWSGSGWVCTTIGGGGSGTVTSVGLSAPTSDFTVSGSPVTKSGTLGLNWTVAPSNQNTANAIVKRDSTGSFSATAISAAISSPTESAISGTDTNTQVGTAAGVYGSGPYGVWGVSNLAYGAGVDGQDAQNVGVSGYGLTGVFGYGGDSTGVYGEGGIGVYGQGLLEGPGVWGVSTNASFGAVEGQDDGNGIGVYGLGYTGYGVYGSASSGYGMVGSGLTGVYGTGTTGTGVTAYNTAGGYGLYTYSSGYTAYFDGPSGDCHVDGAGNLACSGSKSAVVPVDGGSRHVELYAVEAAENWFEDFGSGRLSTGKAIVPFDPTFAQTVDTELDYHVFLTPNGDSRGLYVSDKTAASFEVHEQSGGTSNITFDYRIVARRKGFENIRLAEIAEPEHPKLTPPKAPPAMHSRPAAPNIVRPVVSLKHASVQPH